MAAVAANPYAVKRSLGRCWGFSALSGGLWGFFWLFTYRRLLDGEIGDGRDDAVFHTVGYVVPVLNFFIVYWLWRDLSWLRERVGLTPIPVVPFLIGSIFLAPVFFSLVNQSLNEYWDTRLQGHATDATVTAAEKVLLGVGAALWLFYALFIVLAVVLAIVGGTSS